MHSMLMSAQFPVGQPAFTIQQRFLHHRHMQKSVPYPISSTTAITLLCALTLLQLPSVKADDFWITKGADSTPRSAVVNRAPKKKSKRVLKAKAKTKPDEVQVADTIAEVPRPAAKTIETTTPDKSPTKGIAKNLTESQDSQKPVADPAANYGSTYSSPVRRKWRVGVVIKTGRKPIKDVLAQIPIPQPWPEQEVVVFKNEVPGNFQIEKVQQLDGLQRLLLHGRSIEAGQTVVALMTYIVTTKRINLPADTSVFIFPDDRDKEVKKYTATSAGISFRNKKLKKQAELLLGTASTDWERVEAIYNWVRDNIEQLPEASGARHLGSEATFIKKKGYTDDVTGLFIAMCRVNDVPARMVYVDGSPSAEFMLADPNGEQHWFPCDVTGLPAFGKTVEPKLILQKGDSIKVLGEKGRRKFVPATGICTGTTGTVSPRAMNFVREPRPMEEGQ